MKNSYTAAQRAVRAGGPAPIAHLLLSALALAGPLLLSHPVAAQPTLTSTSPVNNARAASVSGPVSVTFNQAVTAGSAGALKVFSAQRSGLRSAATAAPR